MSGEALSILLIILTVVFSVTLIGVLLLRYIYKIKHHLPTGDCCSCHKGKDKLLKEYRKYYSK